VSHDQPELAEIGQRWDGRTDGQTSDSVMVTAAAVGDVHFVSQTRLDRPQLDKHLLQLPARDDGILLFRFALR